MTRPRVADDFEVIGRRQREIAAETVKRIVGEPAAQCQCPTSPNAQGVDVKAHVPGCPAGVAVARDGYAAMLADLVVCELLAEEELLRVLKSAGLR